MKRLLILLSLGLTAATTSLFAQAVTDPVAPPNAPTQNGSPKAGKHHHKKQAKKGHKKHKKHKNKQAQ
jgi:opacity protein-like surface antigen